MSKASQRKRSKVQERHKIYMDGFKAGKVFGFYKWQKHPFLNAYDKGYMAGMRSNHNYCMIASKHGNKL
jgi:hypothetical protein